MKRIAWDSLSVGLLTLFIVVFPLSVVGETFEVAHKEFWLGGRPFAIRSGELHYTRIPREYWGHRLQMARAMGLNTVSTYVFWNFHETSPGDFDFTGRGDIAQFCREAQQHGLYVILRPGPYVCAEWDGGGMPWWLLKEPDVRIRTRNPEFLERVKSYFKALGEQLAPLQISRGGPVILVQVENEYAGYGRDWQYLETLAGYLRESGFEVPLITTEMAGTIAQESPSGLVTAIGFGGDPEGYIDGLRSLRPDQPMVCAEYYTGWFDGWGQASRLEVKPLDSILEGVEWMLNQGVSFNLYMVHGGTSFGFQSGANHPLFRPGLTSYDYGAPISEAGWVTPKYEALRKLFAEHLADGDTLPETPPANPRIRIDLIDFSSSAPLFTNLPEPVTNGSPVSMESLDQAHGCVLYRTVLPPGRGDRLLLRELRDYAWVYVDGKRVGSMDRTRSQNAVALPNRNKESRLDVLVEAFGRVNFGRYMHERKGITERAELVKGRNVQELLNWKMFPFPLDTSQLASLDYSGRPGDPPAFHRARFQLQEIGDTFLDMRLWGKGYVWVNGHNLGRFWNVGPQQTLYCPGPWLRKGRNEIVVLDLEGSDTSQLLGRTEPILNRLNHWAAGRLHRKANQSLNLENLRPVHEGLLNPSLRWQTVRFEPTLGRYFCFEALDSHPGDDYTTCAELELLGRDGQRISPVSFEILYADSEEMSAEDGSAANILDGKTGTFWHTDWQSTGPSHPQRLVIDLGKSEILTGFRVLPRQDSENGRIKRYRIFLEQGEYAGL